MQEAVTRSSRVRRRLHALIDSLRPEVLILDTLRIGQYFLASAGPGVRRILYMDDLFSLRFRRMTRLSADAGGLRFDPAGTFASVLPGPARAIARRASEPCPGSRTPADARRRPARGSRGPAPARRFRSSTSRPVRSRGDTPSHRTCALDRRRSRQRRHRQLPENVLRRRVGPLDRQVLFRAEAVLGGTAPARPVFSVQRNDGRDQGYR